VCSLVQVLSRCSFLCVLLFVPVLAQEQTAKPAANADPPSEKAVAPKSEQKPALPFQIQLLETHIRFETNGDSRKEVHTIVKINDLAGARQFSRLGFDYNRAFQQVEIPLVRIIHANGGTSEILPSAVTDAPHPAVQDFPAYHDVRVKSVRILGLQEGDTLEYRVITTTTKAPLAPDFWLEHTFTKSGQALEEKYSLEVPKSREIKFQTNLAPTEKAESEASGMEIYQWDIRTEGRNGERETEESLESKPDVVLTTFQSWEQLGKRLWEAMGVAFTPGIWTDAMQRTGAQSEPVPRNMLYDLVSTKIATVDIPIDFGKYRFRDAHEILKSGYANAQDKVKLLDILLGEESLKDKKIKRSTWLVTTTHSPEHQLPRPSLFNAIFLSVRDGDKIYYLDPSLEVAPFGALPSKYRGMPALQVGGDEAAKRVCWDQIPEDLPYPSLQRVNVDAKLATDGSLSARIRYTMRGDNELVLREAFHQTPKERWKEVAGLLALSDGFRGTITNVTASDPMATKDPFTVEYEITQTKFVDWSKKPVRIPALLPQITLPDAPGKAAGKIELGTPLDVQTSLTLRLPEGTTVQTPAATSVARDYATFASKYDGHLNTVSVSRHINFVMRKISVDRTADYNAFLRAVQNDQAQMLVLLPAAAVTTP
jgi:Domain of Unknown Function with PDB structure (DUF3857)